MHREEVVLVLPLRVRLADFRMKKDQRRILRRGRENFRTEVVPSAAGKVEQDLFEVHKWRFDDNIPDDLFTFVSPEPSWLPCEGKAVRVWDGEALVAASYLSVGADSVSSVYGMFHPEWSRHSLGIYTMLEEIEWALAQGKRWYYHGYCYSEPSHYDYKKRFGALEFFDWVTWHRV